MTKILFEPMSLKKNIETIIWAYNEHNGSLDVHKHVLEYFPELKNIDKNMKDNEINDFISKVVTNEYKHYEQRIMDEANRYNKIWEPYNDKYFKALSKYLNSNFRNDLEIIHAYVGLIPVFPRYLDDCSFSLSTGLDEEFIINTSAHETCHFMWFNKWKELYPDCPRRWYDSPFSPWNYSEMVVDPILNSKEIKEVINVNCRAYDSFYVIKDNDTYVMDNLRNIYNEDISIEEKIIKGYEYVKPLFNEVFINQDLFNPDYLFHGSDKELNILEPNQSVDKLNKANEDNAVFLTSSFITAAAYAFSKKIKELNEYSSFEMNNNGELPAMVFDAEYIPNDLYGYVYVFENKDNIIKDNHNYTTQHRSYNKIKPIDKIKVYYKDFEHYFKCNNKTK